MKNLPKVTRIFILLTIIVVLGYDVFAVYNGGTEASVSWQIAVYAYKVPAFTFAVGFVCGHLFWQMNMKDKIIAIAKKARKDGRNNTN